MQSSHSRSLKRQGQALHSVHKRLFPRLLGLQIDYSSYMTGTHIHTCALPRLMHCMPCSVYEIRPFIPVRLVRTISGFKLSLLADRTINHIWANTTKIKDRTDEIPFREISGSDFSFFYLYLSRMHIHMAKKIFNLGAFRDKRSQLFLTNVMRYMKLNSIQLIYKNLAMLDLLYG